MDDINARFMAHYERIEKIGMRAFKHWPPQRKDDAYQEYLAKCFSTYKVTAEKGQKDPDALIGQITYWSILWVRYDRKVAGRNREKDIEDYRSQMTRDDDWHPERQASREDDPAELAEALEATGLTLDDLRE